MIPRNGHPLGSGVEAPPADESPLLPPSLLTPILSKSLARYLAGSLSGLALVACFPALGWRPLVWVALVPLILALVHETRPHRGFLIGYFAGAVFLGGSCYWFIYVTEHYGGLKPVLAFGVLVVFVLIFSLLFGLFGLCGTWIARSSPASAIAISPFLWVAIEFLRTYFLTGFPWNLLGYALPGDGLRQLGSVTGVYGLSFLAAATAALVASALLNLPPQRQGLGAAGLRIWGMPVFWFALLGLINWTSTPPALPPLTNDAYLVQPNVPLNEAGAAQWAPWVNPSPLAGLAAASVEAACSGPAAAESSEAEQPVHAPPAASASILSSLPDCSADRARSSRPRPLIVWSENPAPFYYSRDPVFRAAIEEVARRSHAYVIFNTVNVDGPHETLPANSAMVLDPEARLVMRYDKIHLVPFGEYVPWWGLPGVVGKISSEVGDFVPGKHYTAAATPDGAIAIPICYEDIFPGLVRRLVAKGPGVIVVISNDSWYGDTPAAAQHLEIARLRAIENGRYLLRATNDGVSAVVDPYGRVLHRLPRHRQAVLTAGYSYLAQETFYHAHGNIFAWLCVVVTLGMLVLQFVNRRNAETRTQR